ncbi:hypothetical protein DFJ73DRAFT_840076 [Zopfochytrium polystomum]|nr:hypothetical protein DFJ73DRAFT_840076 [Zopfochytrium polystomum]
MFFFLSFCFRPRNVCHQSKALSLLHPHSHIESSGRKLGVFSAPITDFFAPSSLSPLPLSEEEEQRPNATATTTSTAAYFAQRSALPAIATIIPTRRLLHPADSVEQPESCTTAAWSEPLPHEQEDALSIAPIAADVDVKSALKNQYLTENSPPCQPDSNGFPSTPVKQTLIDPSITPLSQRRKRLFDDEDLAHVDLQEPLTEISFQQLRSRGAVPERTEFRSPRPLTPTSASRTQPHRLLLMNAASPRLPKEQAVKEVQIHKKHPYDAATTKRLTMLSQLRTVALGLTSLLSPTEKRGLSLRAAGQHAQTVFSTRPPLAEACDYVRLLAEICPEWCYLVEGGNWVRFNAQPGRGPLPTLEKRVADLLAAQKD